MDRLIVRFDALKDGDLMLCPHRGVAYQRDMTKGRMRYDAAYLANYDSYAIGPIADALNRARVAMLMRHAAAGAAVLDVGAASGRFVREAQAAGFDAKGYDVIPEAVERLQAAQMYAENARDFDAVTMWDSIEHMDIPELWLRRVNRGALLLAAIPVFEDLARVRESKHYKPGEHFFYWTQQGFVEWMAFYGFRMIEQSSHETDAGRESIGAFAFRKDLPDGDDHVAAYREMHATRFYGNSATELHLSTVAGVVRALKPRSILDYGCGRSDLVAHFWRDGERRIERFDPAIPMWKRMPKRRFDLVLCCDVMEHIPMANVDAVLRQIRDVTDTAFFTISTKPARAKLPDGRNAHVTLLTHSEWMRWIKDYFGQVKQRPSESEHELILLAGAAERMRAAA